mgnify:CR=1 FL=1
MSSQTEANPAIELDAVHVSFGSHEAVCHVDLGIAAGECTVIVGPNGAGKSTLLEVLAGVRVPSSGTVRRGMSAVAFVPQRAAVPDGLPISVREVVAMGAWGRLGALRPLGRSGRRHVDAAMERLDIGALARSPFSSLSGGQRQRALLAQGIARGPDVLLLDEPTTGLDTASADRIREVLRDEAALGAVVVCVSHDEALIAECDRRVRMEEGRIVADTR